jgi:hypothetical protein
MARKWSKRPNNHYKSSTSQPPSFTPTVGMSVWHKKTNVRIGTVTSVKGDRTYVDHEVYPTDILIPEPA